MLLSRCRYSLHAGHENKRKLALVDFMRSGPSCRHCLCPLVVLLLVLLLVLVL